MDWQLLLGTQFLALAFLQNFSRFDSQLALEGTVFLELIFAVFYYFERRDLRARRIID